MKETSQSKNDEIHLNEDGKYYSSQDDVANIMNDYFINIGNLKNTDDHITFPIDDTIRRYADLESIRRIHENSKSTISHSFSLRNVTLSEVHAHICKLNIKKATGYDNIPAKLIKAASKPLASILTELINKSLEMSIFPNELKHAEISPIKKKNDPMNKENYRPISILAVVSKVFERVIEKQISAHFDNIFNENVSGFRKKHSCQHVLLKMTEDWRKALDKNEFTAAIAMDLSKAFDCLPHGLLIAKLRAYGLSVSACTLIGH